MGCVKLYITLILIPMIPMIHDIDNVPKAEISHGISAMAPAALLFLPSGASFLAYAEERLPEKLPKWSQLLQERPQNRVVFSGWVQGLILFFWWIIFKLIFKIILNHGKLIFWLVVSNIWIIFHFIYGIILPIDFHIFKMVETTNQYRCSSSSHLWGAPGGVGCRQSGWGWGATKGGGEGGDAVGEKCPRWRNGEVWMIWMGECGKLWGKSWEIDTYG